MIGIITEPSEYYRQFGVFEDCYFCGTPTNTWHKKTNTPVCMCCSVQHEESEIVKTYSNWVRSDRPFKDYPVGTRARADGGGYWEKTERGWKWCTGATFPTPGGDWDGYVCLP